jgi:hypothetical protein
MGDSCEYRKSPCHPTCLVCIDPEKNECIECAPGFTLVNGYCVECAECCKTCDAANGTGINQCTSCHPGFGNDGNGECKRCHPACKTCSSAWDRDTCTTCHEDSTLTSGGQCQCDFPKVRRNDSWTCENNCSTGEVFNTSTRECETDTTRNLANELDVYLVFDHELPVFNQVSRPGRESVSDVRADEDGAPIALGKNRGAYFQ